MEKQKDNIEERIKEDLYSEAEAIRQKIDSKGTGEVSRDIKNDIRLKLQEKIDTYEKERVYANLSEEDREAMELGKKIQKEQRESEFYELMDEVLHIPELKFHLRVADMVQGRKGTVEEE